MSATSPIRRRLLQAAGGLATVAWWPVARAAGDPLTDIPAMQAFLAGRVPTEARVKLDLPRLADNGLVVPLRVSVDGPFTSGFEVREIRLFSETNPVPEMATFEFPPGLPRVELDTRIRLAGTQHVVAIARMSDGALFAASVEVVVTIAGCMDGT